MKVFLSISFILFVLFSSSAQPISVIRDENPNLTYSTYTNECNRELIITQYNEGYLETNVTKDELAWDGDVDNCVEGSISTLAMERTLQRINYFRQLVGINNDIIFNEVKSQKCQKAALMMDAENKLDHYPTEDWKCSSAEGIEAAGKSNISYGRHSSGSVPQYIQDAGSGNGAVGHRRWILYPRSHEFGFGSTDWGTAMWVIGGTKNPDVYPDFVAYPSPGYFPKTLIYPRWSFSKKGVNFGQAKIKMYNELGESINYVVEDIVNGYGDNTIVWVPQINIYDDSLDSDHYFKVEIDSIKSGSDYIRYEYEVLGITPELIDDEIVTELPSCGNSTGKISLNIKTGFKSIVWSNGASNTTEISGLESGNYSVTITDKINCDKVMEFHLQDQNEAKVLGEIEGNQSAFANQSETYSIDQFENGNYIWTINNGQIIDQSSNHEVSVIWDEGVSAGDLCVYFSDHESCESNEVCIEVALQTSSVNDLENVEIEIIPNPAKDFLSLKWSADLGLTFINVYNSSGEKVQSLQGFKYDNNARLNISTFDSGIYFIQLLNKDKTVVKKFVKK